MTLDKVSVAVFTQALQNIATLRAENGGSVSRLQFSKESAATQRTNLEAANGRIMDVDIASESTRLAKNIIFWCRHQHPCFHRPTQHPMWP